MGVVRGWPPRSFTSLSRGQSILTLTGSWAYWVFLCGAALEASFSEFRDCFLHVVTPPPRLL